MKNCNSNLAQSFYVKFCKLRAPTGHINFLVQGWIDLMTAFAGTIKEIKYYLIWILSSFYRLLLLSLSWFYQNLLNASYGYLNQYILLYLIIVVFLILIVPTYIDIMSNEVIYYELFGLIIYWTLQELFIAVGLLCLLVFMIWDTRSLWLKKS